MKKILLSVLLLMPSIVFAAPYFRLVDLNHPVTVAGALLATSVSESEGVLMLPIFTHSPKDGCLLPSVVCEDWTPLAFGGAMTEGKISFVVAPLANVLPWMQAGAKAIIPESWTAWRAILTPATGSPVTFSAGPAWEYKQLTNKGYYRTVTALALHF